MIFVVRNHSNEFIENIRNNKCHYYDVRHEGKSVPCALGMVDSANLENITEQNADTNWEFYLVWVVIKHLINYTKEVNSRY